MSIAAGELESLRSSYRRTQISNEPGRKRRFGNYGRSYRIENRLISAAPQGDAIRISGTTSAFVIRNVTVADPDILWLSRGSCCYTGVTLAPSRMPHRRPNDAWNPIRNRHCVLEHVVVQDAVVENSNVGIFLRESTHVTLLRNTLVNATIRIDSSTDERSGSHTIGEDNTIDESHSSTAELRRGCGRKSRLAAAALETDRDQPCQSDLGTAAASLQILQSRECDRHHRERADSNPTRLGGGGGHIA